MKILSKKGLALLLAAILAVGAFAISAAGANGGLQMMSTVGFDQSPEPDQSNKPVTSVSLNQTTMTLIVGETGQLNATVAPADATDKTVTWNSDTPSVATVDNTGKVTAIAAGTAKITAKAGTGEATCTVTVNPKTIAVTGVTLNKTSLSLVEGKSETLTATVAPSDATNKNVTWKSSNEAVATVANGTVTAVKEGTADITVTTVDGNKTATCKVTVTKAPAAVVAATGVKLNKTTATVNKGKTITLKATVSPSNATDQKVTWSTSKKSVATVTQKGVVKGVKAGTATITAKTANGKKATCKVTVKVPATKISLNRKTLYMVKGKSLKISSVLKATVTPSDTTDKVSWSTSKKSVVAIQSGKLVAKKTGTATITAKTTSGKKATVSVKVVKKAVKATSVKLNKKSLTLEKGKAATLKATVNPSKTTEIASWSTSNKKVATVDNFGKVTAKKAGKATITVKVGKKKATCKVTVKVSATSVKLNKAKLTLKKGKSATLKANIAPKDTTDKASWSTSNKKVATVSKAGKVTAKKKGTATITVKVGKKKATCKVTVK